MPTDSKSRRRRQALSGKALKEFRSDVAKLKSKGLVSKYKDARKQKPTRYMREQVQKYRDVLEGKATVQRIPRRKAKDFSERFRVKGNAVVIPREKGETIRYSKKDNAFHGTRYVAGKRIKKEYASAKFEDANKLPKLKRNQLYQLTFANGQIIRKDTKEDLLAFMYPYEHPDMSKPENRYRKPWSNWYKYVEIVSIEDADDE